MPPRKTAVPVLSERLMKLQVDIKRADPYEVTDTITVQPITRKRSDAMAKAVTAMSIQQSLLNQAMKRAASPRPSYPQMPEPPAAPADLKDPEALKGYESALGIYEKTVDVWRDALVPEWERLQANWERELERLEESMNGVADKLASLSDEYTKNLFGDAYDDVIGFFDEQNVELWNAFVEDIKTEFGLSPKASQAPEDGRCVACGNVVDEEAAGKAPESSN